MWNNKSVLEIDGENVISARLPWGFERRPFFETIEKMNAVLAVKWSDRFSAFEAISNEWALAGAFEKAFGITVPDRGLYLRCLNAEVQRLLWLYNYLYRVFNALNDSIRAQQAMRLREHMHGGQEIFTGARVLPQIFTLGGIDRDVSIGEVKKLRELFTIVDYETHFFFDRLDRDYLLRQRLTGLTPIKQETCRRHQWTGPIGQASGFSNDLRITKHYGVYSDFKIRTFEDVLEDEEGSQYSDALSRLESVLFQVHQTLELSRQLLARLPEGPIRTEAQQAYLRPDGVWLFSVEAGSGLLIAGVSRDMIKFSSVSTRIAPVIENLLTGMNRDDFDISLASLGFEMSEGDLA